MRRLALALALLSGACATPADPPAASCTSCHGSPDLGPAPPAALGGDDRPGSRGVGAHTAHLFASISAPVACTECHLVPATVDAEGHIDDPWPADMKWGDLGKTDGAEITWNTETLTCSGSYCHGGTMAAIGDDPEPVWNAPAQLDCGSCHQYPPPAPHPANSTCGECHAPTASGGSLADPSTHIDGILQVVGGPATSCSAGCHGDDDQTHPPADLAGSSDPAQPGVGAHASHMAAGVSCDTCHPVPTAVGDPGHLDGTTDLVFDGIAGNDGVTASYDGVGLTCTVYCHGASLAGGTQASPVWNVVDGSQVTCGSCHGNPPPAPHPGSTACAGCHGDGGTSSPQNHINGVLNF